MNFEGGTYASKDNSQNLGIYTFGSPESEHFLAFFGADLPEDFNEYSFEYNGTVHTRNIQKDCVLNIYIYKDKSFHTPQLLTEKGDL